MKPMTKREVYARAAMTLPFAAMDEEDARRLHDAIVRGDYDMVNAALTHDANTHKMCANYLKADIVLSFRGALKAFARKGDG
jgi:hypothetical protein